MATNTDYLVQQIKENCKWYFGHEVQVITFYKNAWYAVVYPAECTLASAAGNQIHLHARSPHSLDYVMHGLLNQLNTRIGESFRDVDGEQAPVVLESEAKCTCVRRTSLLAVAGQGGRVAEVQDVVANVESESVDGVGEVREADTTDITYSPCNLRIPAGSAHVITPVVQEIKSTPEVIEQRTHLREGQPSTTAQLIRPSSELMPTVKSSDQPGASEPNIEPAGPDTFAPLLASLRGDDLTDGAVLTPSRNKDDHTRELIREEMGRVLGAAMASLTGGEEGDRGKGRARAVVTQHGLRKEIRRVLGVAMESLPPMGK